MAIVEIHDAASPAAAAALTRWPSADPRELALLDARLREFEREKAARPSLFAPPPSYLAIDPTVFEARAAEYEADRMLVEARAADLARVAELVQRGAAEAEPRAPQRKLPRKRRCRA